jgi:hypothetical protein
MHDYAGLKERHGHLVSQTIDTPVMIFDYFELGDAFAALAVILLFGVIFYSWGTMCILLLLLLGILPPLRRQYPRGILMHWPHQRLGIALPGLFNPGSTRVFSD